MKKRSSKYMSLFIALAMLFSSCTISAFAYSCPYDGGVDYVNGCGTLYERSITDCPWQGGNGGGYTHPDDCMILKYYHYTTVLCEKCLYFFGNNGYHACYAEHPAAGIYNLILCPY